MVGAVGIEPTTFGLKGRCSTTELRPCKHKPLFYRKILKLARVPESTGQWEDSENSPVRAQ